jgi:hypothetical protein
MVLESSGYKKCKSLIEIMRKMNKPEFSEREIRFIISKHIGFSKLSQERYLYALLTFQFIKRLDNGSYVII